MSRVKIPMTRYNGDAPAGGGPMLGDYGQAVPVTRSRARNTKGHEPGSTARRREVPHLCRDPLPHVRDSFFSATESCNTRAGNGGRPQARYYENIFFGLLPDVQKAGLVASVGWLVAVHYTTFDLQPVASSGRVPVHRG
jgi:hypothetical protein